MSEKEPQPRISATSYAQRKSIAPSEKQTVHTVKASETIVQFYGFLQAKPKHTPPESYSYFSLYRYSTCCEKLLILIGVLAAIAAGFCYPMMVLEFGKLALNMVVYGMFEVWSLRDNLTKEEPCFKGHFNTTGQRYFGRNKSYIAAPYCKVDRVQKLLSLDVKGLQNVVEQLLTEFSLNGMMASGALTVLASIYFFCFYVVGERVSQRINLEYFESFLRKDMKWFDSKPEHDLGTTIMDNNDKIRGAIGESIGTGIHFISLFLVAIVSSLYHGWELALIALVSIPLLVFCTAFVASTEAKQSLAQEKSFAKAARYAEQVFLNITSVFVYGGQKKEFYGFVQKIQEKDKEVFRATLNSCFANSLIWTLVYINYSMTFYFGTKFALEKQNMKVGACNHLRKDLQGDSVMYSPKTLVIVFFSVMFGSLNLGLAYPVIQSVFAANATAKEVLHTIDTKPEVDNLSQEGITLPFEQITGKIDVEEVYFAYPKRKTEPVLNGLTFSIHPGMTVALVGPSGSGKSTFLKLLTKEYLCDSGFIKLDGIDLRYHNTQWLRRQISIVTQGGHIFDCSVEENIRMGKEDATFGEIQDICKAVNAIEFISKFPNGYQTNVGLNGCKLSTGQRQRLKIARALIREAKILLLDEWTAGLGAKSEEIIQRYLKQTASTRTTFVIADKLSSIATADLILVLNDGQVVEKGTHSGLLKNKGLYYDLVTKPLRNSKVSKIGKSRERGVSTATVLEHPEKKLPLGKSTAIAKGGFGTTKTNPQNLSDAKKHVRLSIPNTIDPDLTYTINPKVNEVTEPDAHITTTVIQASELEKADKLWQKYYKRENPALKDSEEKNYGFCSKLGMVSEGGCCNLFFGMVATIICGMALPCYGVIFGNGVGGLACYDIALARKWGDEYSLYFFLFGILVGVAVFIQHLAFSTGGAKAVGVVRKRLFFGILRQDMGWFDNPENNIPNLNSLIGGEAGTAEYILFTFYGVLLECLSGIFIAIIYSASFGASLLTLKVIPLVIPIVIGASMLDNFVGKQQEKGSDEAYEVLSKLVHEVIENKRVITTCQLERHFLQKYKDIVNQPTRVCLALVRGFTYGFAQSAVFWCYCFCMLLAIDEMKRDTPYSRVLITGDNMIFGMLNVAVSLTILPTFNKALGAANRILNVIHRKPTIDSEYGGEIIETIKGDIKFEDVHFSHPLQPDIPILSEINWSVKSGQMIALVGRSGCGKSTSVQLVLKFYNPTKGLVTIDGHDITTLNCASLLTRTAVVEPDPRLFDRTVAENIAYGINDREISIDEIVQAAKAAHIHTFITSLPEGYETMVGRSGSHLSGGQIQRIIIARALLRNPAILILDEATSSLDHDSEQEVLKGLEEARKGRCCIAISHRLYTIYQADIIVVMDEGSVVEIGTHSELLKKGGLYASLWEAQNLEGT